jgi:coatomer protein complex subunit gamma
MIQGIERILKAAIVDKTPSVSSAALVSSYHLCDVAKDIIKRWSNEVQEAINSKPSSGFGLSASNYFGANSGGQSNQSQIVISTSSINQYHAITLLYLIRQHDRMAITKLVQTFSSSKSSSGSGGASNVLKNPSAVCMLVRFAYKVMEDDPG